MDAQSAPVGLTSKSAAAYLRSIVRWPEYSRGWQASLSIQHLFNISSYSTHGIDCEFCSLSGYQPAVYLHDDLPVTIDPRGC